MSASITWIAWNSIERLAELLALLDVLHGRVQRGLADRQAHGGVAQPLDREDAEELAEAAGRDDDVLLGHHDVVEVEVGRRDAAEAHQPLGRAEGEAGRPLLDDDRADALGAGRVGEPAVDEVLVGLAAVGDPPLGAVDDERRRRCSLAVVRMSVAAEPASGSEMATAIVFSPAMMSGSQRSRCSSVPRWVITWAGPVLASKIWKAAGRHTLPNSSITASAWASGAPEPPYCSGCAMPRKPRSPSWRRCSGRDRRAVDVHATRPSVRRPRARPGRQLPDLRVARRTVMSDHLLGCNDYPRFGSTILSRNL